MWLQILFLLPIASALSEGNVSNPVVLIPGDGGNQLFGRINKSETVHWICDKETDDWFTLWLNIGEFVEFIIDCWVDNAKLDYDNVTRTTSNRAGVEVMVPGFGDTESVEWLDPLHISYGQYFNDLADALVAIGYERNYTLRGAPFDFRKAPNELGDYFKNLKQLIEDTYELADGKQVVLVAHSMGAPLSHYFLTHQSQAWKDKYIKNLITLSGAWGGSFKSFKIFYAGDDLGVYILSGGKLKEMEKTMPSIAWLLPWPQVWNQDEVLASTPTKNYSLSNLQEYFIDIGYETGWEMAKDQFQYWDLSPPGVEIHCIYGSNVTTAESMYFTEGDVPTGKPQFINGDGDGTVNARSLHVCQRWENVTPKDFPGVDHQGTLHDPNVIKYVLDIITGN